MRTFRTSSSADNVSGAKPRGAFYGRRKGHPLRKGRAHLMQDVLPSLSLGLAHPAPSDLKSLFVPPTSSVRLEIGFGGGKNLLHEARANPGIGHIGCDVYLNGVAKLVASIAEENLMNVRVHHGDAQPLLDWLPEGGLERLDILYPDPWPKRRHWKRRFISDDRVKRIARAVTKGGTVRFASDIPHYAEWALIRFLRSGAFRWMAETADDWRRPWPGFPGTRYEAKAMREGRKPAYLTFVRS
jgi:tRNA (guanine-N7-)-methyltransferase